MTVPDILAGESDSISVISIEVFPPALPACKVLNTPGEYGKDWAVYTIQGDYIGESTTLQPGHYLVGSVNPLPVVAPQMIPQSGSPQTAPDGTLESDGKGGFRRRPRATPLFSIQEMPKKHWVWSVQFREKRIAQGPDGDVVFWGDWRSSSRWNPNGFPTKSDALRRMMDIMKMEDVAPLIGLGDYEFRVAPQYIGYVAGKADFWWRERYPETQETLTPPVDSTE